MPDSDSLTPAQQQAALEAEMLAEVRAAGIPHVDPSEWACRDGETGAEWRDRLIAAYGGHIPLVITAKRREDVVSIDLGSLRRRDRERLLARRPHQLRRHVVLLLRPPLCRGARTRPRARGRRERRTVRSSARSGDSGSSEPGGDGEPHGRRHDDDVVLRGWAA